MEIKHDTKVTDHEIKQEIERIITNNFKYRKDCIIRVSVENRIVKLNGQVRNRQEKIQAEAIASLVANVAFVRNGIKIYSKEVISKLKNGAKPHNNAS